MCLNHPELVHKHPAHRVLTREFGVVRPYRNGGNEVYRVLMH